MFPARHITWRPLLSLPPIGTSSAACAESGPPRRTEAPVIRRPNRELRPDLWSRIPTDPSIRLYQSYHATATADWTLRYFFRLTAPQAARSTAPRRGPAGIALHAGTAAHQG